MHMDNHKGVTQVNLISPVLLAYPINTDDMQATKHTAGLHGQGAMNHTKIKWIRWGMTSQRGLFASMKIEPS